MDVYNCCGDTNKGLFDRIPILGSHLVRRREEKQRDMHEQSIAEDLFTRWKNREIDMPELMYELRGHYELADRRIDEEGVNRVFAKIDKLLNPTGEV